jgi:hypothetical protein
MSTWSIISNTSSIVQLLGAGINVIQFLLARTNLTGAERARTQRLRDGRLLALELISCSQRGTPIPPACFSRLEQYCLDALASHQAYGARTLGADIWRGSPDSIMLANLENQQLMILEVLADLIRAKDDLTGIRQSNAHNTQVITEKLSIIEGNTNHQNRFINWPAVAAEPLQLPDESRGSLQKPSNCKKTSVTSRQRQQRTIQKKSRGRYICFCICHNVIKVGGRQWHIKIQDPRNFYTCTCSCTSFTVESWFGSSKFRNAFALDFFVTWRDGITISPTIRVAQVVPFTSPGFAVAKKLRRGIITLDRAKAELHQLFAERKASPLDVDPNNQSLFQVRKNYLYW